MSQLFVHIPANLFPDKVRFLLNRRLQPEVACQDVDLNRLDFERLSDCAMQLRSADLNVTLHAPYVGFSPGDCRAASRRQTRNLTEKTLMLAEKLQAQCIVFHPGLAFRSTELQQAVWLENSYAFWLDYLPWAQDNRCPVCIENIYESSPLPLLKLIDAVNSPYFGHVFDIGHWNIFACGQVTEWLEQTRHVIRHLHLHDNHGDSDEHLAIGKGSVPFSDMFLWLERSNITPSMTIENHNPAALDFSLNSFNALMARP